MTESNFDALSIASVSYMTVLGITGIILNSLAIRRALKAKKTKQNIILTNLIVCELLISCLGVPIDAVGAATHASIMTNVLCPLVAFIHTLLGMNCLYTIIAMAIIRYLSVVQGDCSWNTTTKSTVFSNRLVLLIWFTSIVIAILPVVGFGEFSIDVGMISCAPNWTGVDGTAQFYNIILIIFGFFFPTMILLITNAAVLRTSKKQERWRRNNSISYSESTRPSSFQDNESNVAKIDSGSTRKIKRRHGKTTILLLIMTVSFYVSWTPYAISSILAMSGISLPRLVNVISILCSKSGTVINPILYIFYNKSVTRSKNESKSKKMCSKRICRSKSDQDTNNRDRLKGIETVISLQNIKAFDNDCNSMSLSRTRSYKTAMDMKDDIESDNLLSPNFHINRKSFSTAAGSRSESDASLNSVKVKKKKRVDFV